MGPGAQAACGRETKKPSPRGRLFIHTKRSGLAAGSPAQGGVTRQSCKATAQEGDGARLGHELCLADLC